MNRSREHARLLAQKSPEDQSVLERLTGDVDVRIRMLKELGGQNEQTSDAIISSTRATAVAGARPRSPVGVVVVSDLS